MKYSNTIVKMDIWIVITLNLVVLYRVNCAKIYSETGRHARLDPIDPVVKEGETVKLVCTSPANYTGEHFNVVKFQLQHNGYGKNISETEDADSIKGVHSVKEYEIKINGQKDAGVYTCLITTSNVMKNVNARTHLYKIKAEEVTVFGVVGEDTDITCLEASVDDTLTSVWKVNGDLQPKGRVYTIQKTDKEDAFKNYRCLVLSKSAWDAYGNDSVTHKSKAKVVEVNVTLSVIDIHKDCNGKERCRFEAVVTGETDVNITWLYEGEMYEGKLNYSNYDTVSKTPWLNFTSTSSIQLTVTDGHNTGIFKKNITRGSDVSPRTAGQSSDVGGVVGAVVGAVIVAIVGIILIVVLYRKRSKFTCKEKKGNESTSCSKRFLP